MTASLTDNLPLLAEAPNGIKKLRELILELAVRGKLVPQDPSDEPASELLKRIAEEKAQVVAEGKIKKTKPIEEIAEEEWPFVLPVGWEWSRLGYVSEYIQRGKGPAYVEQSDFRVVSQKCVRWTGLDLQPARFIAPESLVKYESIRFLRSGDILWNSTGTGTIGRACVVENCSENERLVADSHVTVVRPTGLLPVFLWRWIQSPSVQSELEGNASGTTNQIELNTSTVIAHLTPIPPLAEQHRIVAKIDELMALCDRLEAQQAEAESAHTQLVQALLDSLTQASDATDFAANWQRLAEHFHTLFSTEPSIDALKRTLLQLAVMGKLVPQDPNDESASVLLKRITEEKAQLVAEGKLKEQKPLSDIKAVEAPFELPSSWTWARFGNICAIKGELVRPEDFPSLRQVAPDCIEKGTGRLTDNRTVKDSNVKGPNSRFFAGQIVYSKIRPSLSKAVLVDFDGLCSADMYPIDAFISSEFLLQEILSEVFLEQVRVAENRIKMPKLNQESLTNFVLPIPPLAEQHRIVAKIDQLMALCDQLKARLTQARQLNEQLASTLVEQAVA